MALKLYVIEDYGFRPAVPQYRAMIDQKFDRDQNALYINSMSHGDAQIGKWNAVFERILANDDRRCRAGSPSRGKNRTDSDPYDPTRCST